MRSIAVVLLAAAGPSIRNPQDGPRPARLQSRL